ncbi:MAG: CHASE3 domain-containing protein, partial [Elusimicrobia bacterium]|nr:CHASE3 domain-containing protein [Elusimicrobiota bacterium]
MIPAPLPSDESERLTTLRSLGLLDTPAEERFDRIVRLAQNLFDVPIALISLVDADRQWFKAKQGLEADQTPRDVSFCAHAILGSEIMEVPDATQDERFWDNPLVTGAPDLRFYAGAPLSAPNGRKIGTLCLIDRTPRKLTGAQQQILLDLAELVESEIAATVPSSWNLDQESAAAARRAASADRKIAFGFAAALATMLIAAVASYQGVYRLLETTGLVVHTHQVLANLGGVRLELRNQQSAARAFVITGDASYLRAAKDAEAGLGLHLAALRGLVADNPGQLRRLDRAEALIARRLKIVAETVASRRASGFKAAAAKISSGEPQKAMDAAGAALGEMSDAERLLLVERSGRVESQGRVLILVASFARVVGALVIILAFVSFRGYRAARRRAEAELTEGRNAAVRDATARRQAQEETKRLSDRLRTVLDQMDSGVILVDGNRGISIFNLAAERIHGAWRDEVERVMRSGTHPPMRLDEKTPLVPSEDPVTQALKGETVRDARLFLRTPFRPNGYYISVSAAPVRSPQGMVTGAVLVFREVTEQIRAEKRQSLQYEAIRLLAETRVGADPIPGLLRLMGERLGWAYGGFWTPDMSDQRLRPAARWSSVPGGKLDAFERASGEIDFERGVGLPGRAWRERRPVWIGDVTAAQNFPRIDAAQAAGLRGALAFPVLVGERCLGVMELYSTKVEESDSDLMELVSALGAQIGLFLDGRRAEEDRTRFFKLSQDMLCVAGFDGYFKDLNPGWEKTLGWTKEELMAVPYMEFVHPDDRQLTLDEAGRIAVG